LKKYISVVEMNFVNLLKMTTQNYSAAEEMWLQDQGCCEMSSRKANGAEMKVLGKCMMITSLDGGAWQRRNAKVHREEQGRRGSREVLLTTI
jgi:hypothetical protein